MNGDDDNIALFALNASADFAQRVADHLGLPLSDHEEREFDDGEHKVRPLVSVRGRDVFLIHTLYSEPHATVNDKLCGLLFFLGALRDAGAARVNAVVPYLCYARKEQRTKPRGPVTTRYIAALLEAVGVDTVIASDVHNRAAFDNAFRCPTVHLQATPIFVQHFASLADTARLAVVSPDVGGVKRAELFRQALSEAVDEPVAAAFMEKRRSGGVVSGEMLIGDVRDRTAIIFDDLIATGTTLVRAARACRREGAATVLAAATHGLFVGGAPDLLAEPAISRIVVTNTVPPFRVAPALREQRLTVLDAAPRFAAAIRRIHHGEPAPQPLPQGLPEVEI